MGSETEGPEAEARARLRRSKKELKASDIINAAARGTSDRCGDWNALRAASQKVLNTAFF